MFEELLEYFFSFSEIIDLKIFKLENADYFKELE